MIVAILLVFLLGCRGESTSPDPAGIRLAPVATLGTPTDPSSPHVFASATAWVEGTFVVAPTFDDGVLHVYSSQGAIIDQLGGSGGGPGEFSPISIFAARTMGEKLWVSSQHDARLTGFDRSGNDAVALATSWPILDFVPLSSDRILVLPLGTRSASVSLLNPSSGAAEDLPLPEEFQGGDGNRGLVLGRGKDGRAWLASAESGVIAPVNETGVQADRFLISPELETGEAGRPEGLGIYAVWEDEGVLWVLVRIKMEEPIPGPITVGTMDRNFDTRIYALDVQTRQVIGELQDDRFLAPVSSSGGNFVSHVFENPDGDTRIGIFEVGLGEGPN